MKPARSFASDNNAGVHAEVFEAIAAANRGHTVGYGDDPFTRSALRRFEQHFGSGISVFPVFNGTAANVLSLAALARSFHAVICGTEAHLYEDECGAPEKFVGSKLLPVPTSNGKLTVEAVRRACHGAGDVRHGGRLRGGAPPQRDAYRRHPRPQGATRRGAAAHAAGAGAPGGGEARDTR